MRSPAATSARSASAGEDASLAAVELVVAPLRAQRIVLPERGKLRVTLEPGESIEWHAAGGKAGKLSHSDQTALLDAYRVCWRVQAASKLLSDKPLDPSALGEGGRAFLLREAGEADTQALTNRLATAAGLAETVISAHLKG